MEMCAERVLRLPLEKESDQLGAKELSVRLTPTTTVHLRLSHPIRVVLLWELKKNKSIRYLTKAPVVLIRIAPDSQ